MSQTPILTTIAMELDIIHPCGHQHDLNDSLIESHDRYESDHYACPTCGMRWHIQKSPPIIHKSGWVEPGKRTVVIDHRPA